MAAADPAHRQPGATQSTVRAHRLECVCAARRLKPAVGPRQWANVAPVPGDASHHHPGAQASTGGLGGRGRVLGAGVLGLGSPVRRSAPRRGWPVASSRHRPPRPFACVCHRTVPPTAASICLSPGPGRRRDLPGVRSRPVDEPGLQAGYLPGESAGTRAPETANGGGPCFSPQHRPRSAPRRTLPAGAGPPHWPGSAGARSAAPGQPASRAGR
jgi:hypothetical protein